VQKKADSNFIAEAKAAAESKDAGWWGGTFSRLQVEAQLVVAVATCKLSRTFQHGSSTYFYRWIK
jgi:hypothetical protein